MSCQKIDKSVLHPVIVSGFACWFCHIVIVPSFACWFCHIAPTPCREKTEVEAEVYFNKKSRLNVSVTLLQLHITPSVNMGKTDNDSAKTCHFCVSEINTTNNDALVGNSAFPKKRSYLGET